MKESKKISRPVIFMIDNFGLSHYTSYLARGVSNYQRVILYGLSKDDFLATGESYGKKIEFHSLDSMLPKGNSIPVIIIKSLFLFFTLLIGLIDRNYDIVHVQGHLPTFFLLIPLIKLKRKKIVWTVHDVELLPSSAGLRGKLDVLYTKLISQPWILGKYSNVIIVHDSFRFSVSGVIPLAYTFAKPVVVSRVSSLTEYVEHNKTGLIFNTDNSKELADCIINLVENNTKCLQMGRNAYEKVTTEMSLETCCALVDNIYNSLGT